MILMAITEWQKKPTQQSMFEPIHSITHFYGG